MAVCFVFVVNDAAKLIAVVFVVDVAAKLVAAEVVLLFVDVGVVEDLKTPLNNYFLIKRQKAFVVFWDFNQNFLYQQQIVVAATLFLLFEIKHMQLPPLKIIKKFYL